MKTLTFFLLMSIPLFGQTDWHTWEAAVPDYTIDNPYNSTRFVDSSSAEMEIISAVRNGYAFLISDLDGNNCPFYPSCSRFFVLSIKETNFFQGLLMFADRFTRDTNIFKSLDQYPKRISGRFFDPVYLYTLDADKLENAYYSIHSND